MYCTLAVDRSTIQFLTLLAKDHSTKVSNFPFIYEWEISSLKILKCATNRDSLLLPTLWYLKLGLAYHFEELKLMKWLTFLPL